MEDDYYVIGIDYGTDSVRAVIVGVESGQIISSSLFLYSRWKEGKYCNPANNQFRQHPLDYIEGLEKVLKDCFNKVSEVVKKKVIGLSIATTGSTPVAVNAEGIPLALLDAFKENPNAMFILWKDHSAAQEAEEINKKGKSRENDYLKYVGGSYSSEWYWAKLLHILRLDNAVREHSYSFVEHSDWLPFLLTGGAKATDIKRNVCAAGHKALWANEFGGLPPVSFFKNIDPLLEKYVLHFGERVYSAGDLAGKLSKEWAERLDLSTEVKVGVGAIDAHVGAVGGGIKPYFMSKVIGTSTCDMMVVPKEEIKGKVIEGISGQVENSIIPGMVGLEAGQSAFGDIYSWFRDLLLWPFKQKPVTDGIGYSEEAFRSVKEKLLKELDQQAATLPLKADSEFAMDWFNGRRSPFVDPNVKGMIGNLTLGSTPVRIYRALVEATCLGSRAIIESISGQGIEIRGVNAVGGIAIKSNYVIQTLSDILNRPIHVQKSEQSVALGAALFAAVVCGYYENVEQAYREMTEGEEQVFMPNKDRVEFYDSRFDHYKRYGACQY